MSIQYKNIVDNILKNDSDNLIEKLSIIIVEEHIRNSFSLLCFCLGYLPMSISEDLLLFNYKILKQMKINDWIKLIENITFNIEYAKEVLSHFLGFYTNAQPSFYNVINLKMKKQSKFGINNSIYKVSNLDKDNPMIQRKFRKLNLSKFDIEQISLIGVQE